MANLSLEQQNVQVGSRLLAPDDLVITGDGHVVFEEDVICGVNVRVIAEWRDIRIGARAWLGDNAEIRASVGANSIVAANSVVAEDVPVNAVMDGNPAKHIWQVC
jgi:acetyltransferase-like isoleucine patch superfamily enzyme